MMTLFSHFRKKPAQLVAGGLLAVGAVVAPLTSLLAPTEAALAQTKDGDLDRAIAALRAIKTMRADFIQTDRQGQSASGVLSLKRPGKIRFDYGKDAELLVVSNGKSLYMVDYEVNQVERWPIKNSPLGALLDPSRDVRRYGTLIDTGSSEVVSVIVEDPKKPEFGAINLIFVEDAKAPGGLRLMNWIARDAQNYRTTVRLSNHRYGVAIAESTFTFRDPRRSSRRPR